jgi:hypothetical protein
MGTLNGWRSAFTMRKARVRGDLGDPVLRTGVVFRNNRRIIVDREFRKENSTLTVLVSGHAASLNLFWILRK